MKNKYLKSTLFLIVIFAFSMTYGQKSGSFWTQTTKNSISQNTVLSRDAEPEKAQYYLLDLPSLKSSLQNVPQRDSGIRSKTLLEFPNSNGSMETFRIMEYSVMDPQLQEKFPDIRSYVGYGLKNANAVIYFSISPDGLHTMTMSTENGTEFINPYTTDGAYEVFSRRDMPIAQNFFECGVVDDGLSNKSGADIDLLSARNANDGMRRTFRLAVGTSIEYTDFHGGKVASALAAINTTMTRVNGIYDRELSIRMTLVANNDLLISTTGNSIFSNGENVSANTGIINGLIGASSYDIGHSFTTGSGGRAQLRSVCTSSKGAGTTGLPDPIGDPFAIDYVSHEMGHQFGATHTFNGSTGNCAGGNRSSTTAYEPGSGSTIMSYAGICTPQNVQNNSDDYFHQASLQQIFTNITVGNSTCGVLIATGNSAPTANAGASYNIPISTPYKLTGSSTDADGTSAHTYTWEQYDLGPAGRPTQTTEFGPMVRSYRGTSDPVRYIPKLEDIVQDGGVLSSWEKLPSVGRVLNFVLTVRDNDTRGGQTAVDDMSATVVASAGPFKVTSQASDVTWEIGSYKTVTWDVANTNVAPVNTPNVNIKLSVDGGVTFPYVLASNVPNNGSRRISVPEGTVTNQARIMVEGAGNIFYNVNIRNFKISKVDYLLNFAVSSDTICQPNNAVYNFIYNTYQGYNQSTTFSAANLPAGATAVFNPTSATADGTSVSMTVSGLGGLSPGNYELTAVGTSGNLTSTSVVTLDIYNSTISPTTLITPANGATSLDPEITLKWNDDINAQAYLVEVSTTTNFSNIVASATVANTSFTTTLQEATTYYWRVTSSNQCATGAASSINSFSTYQSACDMYTATDTPIEISATGTNQIYNSVIAVAPDFPVLDVNVKVNIAHVWVNDLKLVLISPKGTRVVLSEFNGADDTQNYTNTIFDQEATNSIVNATAPFTGSFIPEEPLSTIYGEMSAGNWTLEVSDPYNEDGGSIDEFTLELCLAQPLSVEDIGFDALAIFPNPNNGEFTVKLQSGSSENITIDVYDIRGRKILGNSFKNTTNFRETIRLDNAQPGMYLIHISDGLRKVTKKVLVK